MVPKSYSHGHVCTTISTRLVRRRDKLPLFENYLSHSNITLFDDKDYKQHALTDLFSLNREFGFSYSLVDCVLREMLKDVNVKIDTMITYNGKDFIDVYSRRRIDIVDNKVI